MKDSKLPSFIKIVVLVVIVACIAPFYIKGRDGRPLLRLDMVKMPEVSTKVFSDLKEDAKRLKDEKVPQMVKKVTGALQSKPSVPKPSGRTIMKMYRWKDASGVMHYSDRPNPSGPSEKVNLSLDDIKPLPKKEIYTKKPVAQKEPLKKKPVEPRKDQPAPYELPEKLKDIKEYVTRAAQLKKDAEAVKKQLEENYQKQQQILDDLSQQR